MDMKKILQALDNAASKPVEGSESMAKFLRVVKEAELNQPEMEEGIFDAPSNPQIEALKIMLADPKYASNPQWKAQLEKRLKIAQDRASLDQGMAVGNNGQPKPVLAPDEFTKANPTFKESQLNEGKNPHKVSLPVQMAMNHYQQPAKEKLEEVSVFKTYLTVVEEDIAEQQNQKTQLYRQYSKQIAESVLKKNSLGK